MRTLDLVKAGDAKLVEIVRRLVDTYRPECIYLFGSRARGEAGPDSDYDLMVVLPDESPAHLRQGRLAYIALRGTGTAVDVVVTTRSAFERRRRVPASLPAIVEREGAVLYAA